ncbi:MAG: hypothetical protein EOO01_02940, partial [Chitinophagaceae bacterium]
ELLYNIWIAVQVAVAIVLLFPVISYIVYELIPKKKKLIKNVEPGDYAFIVTAYMHTGNLDNVIGSLLKTDHPNFMIYLVADNCPPYEYHDPSGRVIILHPQPSLTNQVKSHFYAIENFKRDHNRMVIIDSDNLLDSGFLKALDPWFSKGYEAVQGVRTAKNHNTPLACLDAINEMYYLFYDRKILFAIGSSSMLSGSGMAFTTKLYKKCLGNLNTSGAGFDKVLQYAILSSGYRIAFEENAIVFDEKTAHADQLVKQRARWNNTWFRFFPFSLKLIGQGLLKLSLNRFLFGFILFRPPLFILVILTGILIVLNLFINPVLSLFWIVAALIFVSGFFLALRRMNAPAELYRALKHIPKFILLQVRSLFKAKKANQYSVATEHRYHKEIDEVGK